MEAIWLPECLPVLEAVVRVLVDMSCLGYGFTGIGRYAWNLALSLQAMKNTLELEVLSTPESRQLAGSLDAAWHFAEGSGRDRDLAVARLIERRRIDVMHSPLFVLPSLRACPMVCTIHDVIPLSRPELTHPRFGTFFREQIPRSLRRAAHVVTVSEFSRSEVILRLPVASEFVSVVAEPVSPTLRPGDPGEARRLLAGAGVAPGAILCVGAIDKRKNLGLLVAAYGLLCDAWPGAPELVIVGGPSGDGFDLPRLLANSQVGHRVKVLGRVTDDLLVALYSTAGVFAFPSLYEGFGLPPLEAMACGAPVVASNAASLPEVLGDAAVLLDPSDVAAWRDALYRCLRDEPHRRELSTLGLARSRAFTVERQGRQLSELYRSLLAWAA